MEEEMKEKINNDNAAKSCKGKMTTIGGQALLEGLMMIGPGKLAMAVRKPDGTIHVESSPIGKSSKATKIPFLRGSVKIFRQMVTGTKYLMKSANFADVEEVNIKPLVSETIPEGLSGEDENVSNQSEDIINQNILSDELKSMMDKKPHKNIKKAEKKKKGPGMIERVLSEHTEIVLYLSAIFGILLSVGLFILLPNLITSLIDRFIGLPGNRIFYALIEGVIRITIFITYLALASKIKDIKRVWMYHGAEHKTIACYESNKPLTVENVRGFSKHHPRCGTAFMFIILIVSIILFSFIPRTNFILLNMLIRLALVPLLAGISYEIIHLAAKHDNFITRTLSWPGLMLQRLTTSEPDDLMLEVAIAAMMPVIPEDRKSDNW